MITLLAIAASLALTPAAMPTPPGELPVDPYEVSNSNAGAEPLSDPAVFEAFGGIEGIDRIVDDMVERITVDPRLADIFRASDFVRLRRTLKEQFCYLLGGPCDYTGMPMRSSHADHGITTAEFNALVENLQLAMDAEGVPFRMQNRLLALLAPMQRDIVTR
ncbi:MAG: hemoglobin [Oceanicaulis sp. HLUCCA04]|nr:MAG: hemoglobin [Oceanicaulis sp. HLUCCA04]